MESKVTINPSSLIPNLSEQTEVISEGQKEICNRIVESVNAAIEPEKIEKDNSLLLKIGGDLNKLKMLLDKQYIRDEITEAFLLPKFYYFLRMFTLDQDRSTREYAFETFQKILMLGEPVAEMAKRQKMHVILAYSLGRDCKSLNLINERNQVLKCIQVWITRYPKTFPFLLAQSLISICKNFEDTLRKRAISTLSEIATRSHEVCSYMGGFKIIVDSLIDLSNDKLRYDYCINALLTVINSPVNRRCFRDVTELTRIFSIFTVAEVNDKEIDEKTLVMMNNKYIMAKQVILAMIRHWTGLLYLASDPTGIKSLVQALAQPILEVKKITILDLFIEIFSQKVDDGSFTLQDMRPERFHDKYKVCILVSNYMSFVLLAFIKANLYEVLMEIILSDAGNKIKNRAKFLLKRIMQMAFKIVPNYPHLPFLIKTATDFSTSSDEYTRSSVSRIVKELSEINTLDLPNPFKRMFVKPGEERLLHYGTSEEYKDSFDHSSSFFVSCLEYFMRHSVGVPSPNEVLTFNSEFKYLFSSSNEKKFRNKLVETKVNQTKELKEWDWEYILQIFESGVLNDEDILEDVLKTRFLKRLLKFYFPRKKGFVTLDYSRENHKYAKVGYYLIKTLVTSKLGRKVLSSAQDLNLLFGFSFQDNSDNIFKDSTCFMQEVAELMNTEVRLLTELTKRRHEEFEKKDKERNFSRRRLNTTMMREFISWLGIFTSTIDGSNILLSRHVFSALKNLVDPMGINDTFCQLIIRSFDCSNDQNTQQLFIEWLKKGSKNVKLEIFEVFRTLYRSGSSEFTTWSLPYLITFAFNKIYDECEIPAKLHPEVQNKALSILKEAIEDFNILDEIVRQPYFSDEKLENDSFLIKTLCHPKALEILTESGWVERILQKWKVTESIQYVRQVTALLNEELIKGSTDFSESYAFVISSGHLSLSEDLRNDSVILKRLPMTLKLSVENSSTHEMFYEFIHTYCSVDPSGMTLTGSFDNSVRFSNPLNLTAKNKSKKEFTGVSPHGYDDVTNIKVALKIGTFYIESTGQDIELPDYIICDADKIRNSIKVPGSKNLLRVRTKGCNFLFEKVGENSVKLREIKVKIKILPDNYQGKSLPINLYAEMVRTLEATEILRKSNHVEDFKKQLIDEETHLSIKRALLWTFGMIGSSDNGVELLEEYKVLDMIVDIAENSEYLSVRGNALMALSMICRCERGKTSLKAFKWYRADAHGISCLPEDSALIFPKIARSFDKGICNFEEKWEIYYRSKENANLTQTEEEILSSIIKLGNSLKSQDGEKEIRYAQTQKPQIFSTSYMMNMIINVLSMYKFKHSTRKRILQLVDKNIKTNNFGEDWDEYL